MNTDVKYSSPGIAYGPVIEPWVFWPAIIALGLVFRILFSNGASWYWFIPAMGLPLTAAFTLMRRGFVDIKGKRVVEDTRVFGKILLRKRVMNKEEFSGITFERAGDPEEWRVGLHHKSGRKIWLRECGSELRHAEEFAWRLSFDTGIKMEEVRRRK